MSHLRRFALALLLIAAVVAVMSSVWQFKVRFLLTDIGVWVLVLGLASFVIYGSGREEYRLAWRQLRVRALALVCGGIVGVFALIGIVDSFHFQRTLPDQPGVYDPEILSLLDVLVRPLRERTEKTFSAPLATHAYTREMIEQPDGTGKFDYPRLRYAGAHLTDTSQATGDILRLALRGALFGLLSGAVLTVLLMTFLSRRTALGAGSFITVVCILIGAVASVSADYHVLGTDKIGQDILYRALKGCRTGLVVGTVTTLIVTPFALLFGISAGYFGGKIDDIVQYIYTTISSIPDILLIAAAMLIVVTGTSEEQTIVVADRRLMWLCVILGMTGWTELCRLLRAETLKIREVEYVQAARAFGVKSGAIMMRHIVPNVLHIVLISVMLRFSGLVLFEAVLAYVGIGVDPSTESWGNLINSARSEMVRDPLVWWSLLASFLFMFGLVLPANIFGDAVRDSLDPRLRTE